MGQLTLLALNSQISNTDTKLYQQVTDFTVWGRSVCVWRPPGTAPYDTQENDVFQILSWSSEMLVRQNKRGIMGVVVLIDKQPPWLMKFSLQAKWSIKVLLNPHLVGLWPNEREEVPLLTVWQYDLGIFQSALWMQVDRIRMSDRPLVYSSIAVRCRKLLDPTRLTDRQQSGNGCHILDLAFAAQRKSSVRFSTIGRS